MVKPFPLHLVAGLQQGQQMGPAFMNAYHYGSMFYPMYPMPGFSAPSVSVLKRQKRFTRLIITVL